MASYKVLERLPRFPDRGQAARWKGLRVGGLVATPLELGREELLALPSAHVVDDFRCEEGWKVPALAWDGVPVRELLRAAQPLPQARFVAFSAGDFSMSLTIEEARSDGAILALRLNGQPLPPAHGGPCRLIVAGKECYFSVKWVDHIEVLSSRPLDTGRDIALTRIGRL